MIEREAVLAGSALGAPTVGIWRPALAEGDPVRPGRQLGSLTVLGRRSVVLAPEGALGAARALRGPGPVGYGDPLLELGEAIAESAGAARASETSAAGWPVRAPIGGIFYLRSAPGAPPFAELGATVAAGQTLGLIEVMKTFNPVRLEGSGAPASGVVASVEVRDHQEVVAGQVLLRVQG